MGEIDWRASEYRWDAKTGHQIWVDATLTEREVLELDAQLTAARNASDLAFAWRLAYNGREEVVALVLAGGTVLDDDPAVVRRVVDTALSEACARAREKQARDEAKAQQFLNGLGPEMPSRG